ncbi:MAG TPA: TetR/AcrR family transcriptional regulator [Solirubrobacteraceae bacterium]|jgi:AcrR family transcriptional regulator
MKRTSEEPSPLYRRLPHGPNGMGREAVARNQRSRLCGAMIESVSQRGYRATTVAHVIGLAGVSRRAFYELFQNKEHCFMCTYAIVVADARKRMLEAWAAERGWANRLHAACKTLLDDAALSPNGPRLVLVDALGVGAQARERLQLAGLTFERLVSDAFKAAPNDVGFPALIPRAAVGGVRHLLFVRLLEAREQELLTLTDEVLDWIEAYRTPAAPRLDLTSTIEPPHVAPTPAAFLAREGGRARLLGSVVHLTLDSGYAELTDPQIAQFAGVSTEAFHKQFAGKEACYLAVLDEFVREAIDTVRPQMQAASSWAHAVHRTVTAFVEFLVAHQALLRIAFIELFEVGPGMVGRMTRSVEAVTRLLTEPGPVPQRAPAIAPEAVTGALWGIICTFVAGNRLARLPALVDQMTFVVLAPYIGAKAAIEAVVGAREPLGAP